MNGARFVRRERDSRPSRFASRLADWRAAACALAAALSLLLPGAAGAQDTDTTAPIFTGAQVEGNAMVVYVNEDLASGGPSGSAFSVAATVGGTTTTIAGTGSATAVGNTTSQRSVQLSSAVPSGATVTVSYTKPAANGLKDNANNFLASFSGKPVRNNTRVPKAEGAQITKDDFTKLRLYFDRDLGSAAVGNAAFAVKKTPSGGMEAGAPLHGTLTPAISGRTVTLTLASAVAATDTVNVSYTKPTVGSNNRIRSPTDVEAASFNLTVSVIDSRRPTYTGTGNLDDSINAPPGTLVSLNMGLRGSTGGTIIERLSRAFTDPDGDALTVTMDPPEMNIPPYVDDTPSHNGSIGRFFATIGGMCLIASVDPPLMHQAVVVTTVKATDPHGAFVEVTRRWLSSWRYGDCPEFKSAQVAGRKVTLTMERTNSTARTSTASASQFTVMAGASGAAKAAVEVTGVTVGSDTTADSRTTTPITLTLAEKVPVGHEATLTYDPNHRDPNMVPFADRAMTVVDPPPRVRLGGGGGERADADRDLRRGPGHQFGADDIGFISCECDAPRR